MKTLLLARHGKSSWEGSDLSDFERPLNSRGRRDAPLMGRLLMQIGVAPDLIVTSPANRAFTTARIVAGELHYPLERIEVREQLYEANSNDILTVVQSLDESQNTVLLFGHNPGLMLFCNFLVSPGINDLPTCGIVGIHCNVDSWKEVAAGNGGLYLYEYPKKYAS
jgi:phosphohistidine phosphatase